MNTNRPRATWAIGRRELVAMVVGALLYGGLSYLNSVFKLQAAPGLQIRPGVAVPIFFGFVYGPWVGLVTGLVGNFIGDWSSGLLPYCVAHPGWTPNCALYPTGNAFFDFMRTMIINWQVGNGLMGLVPGLAALFYRQYYTGHDQLRALAVTAGAILAGIGFASFTHVYVDAPLSLEMALNLYFLPTVKVNLVNAAVLVPLLLFNYEHIDLTSMDWLHSGLMQRLLLAILISAALPVALLGLFLTQQATTTVTVSSTELLVKVAFTIVLALLFSVTNAALLAQVLSRPLLRLTNAAQAMEAGKLTETQAGELTQAVGTDEISRLSLMFGRMAQEVIMRETKLRKQVEALKIEIDEVKCKKQVEEITDSDFFRNLQTKARSIRRRDLPAEASAPAKPLPPPPA